MEKRGTQGLGLLKDIFFCRLKGDISRKKRTREKTGSCRKEKEEMMDASSFLAFHVRTVLLSRRGT